MRKKIKIVCGKIAEKGKIGTEKASQVHKHRNRKFPMLILVSSSRS